jgi:hypothetical protein
MPDRPVNVPPLAVSVAVVLVAVNVMLPEVVFDEAPQVTVKL